MGRPVGREVGQIVVAGQGGEGLGQRCLQAVQRREPPVAMPAWQEEPAVNAHIMDLYAYLSARADGRQNGDRPTP